MDKIETDCIWVFYRNLEKSRPDVFQGYGKSWIAWIKDVFAQNHLVCDVTIILSVKKFHITIFEF